MNGRRVWFGRLALALCLCLGIAGFGAWGAGAEEKAHDITPQCTVKVSEGDRHKLTDGNVRSLWTPEHANAYVGIKLPRDAVAGWLRVEWMYDPTAYELIEFDAAMTEIQHRDQTCTFPNIYSMYPLLPETKYIQLKLTEKGQSVCTVKVYSAGELSAGVQVWNPPVEKADLMVVSTHQDDELIFLGGTIPYYATALKKPTIVVYMANCTRYRRNEALNALWVMGVRDYPEFINLTDKRVGSINEGIRLWGGKDNILSLLVERIRRFKPEVIVTQDLNGEYGHNQHKITARAMKYAIDAAADPEKYPDSFRKYGAWQVKKLYHHLYRENALMMDWETPLDSLNGYSPLKVAQIGMDEHASQLKYYSVKSHGTYDNAKFGLYFTTVGQDVARNDFLEHIDPDASAKYLAEHGAADAERLAAAQAAEAENAPASTVAPVIEEEGEPQPEPPAEAYEADAEDPGEDVFAGDATEDATGDVMEGVPLVAAAQQAAETAGPTLAPQSAPPRAGGERDGGSAALAVAMIAAGVAVAGGCGWYAWRTLRGGRRRGRR